MNKIRVIDLLNKIANGEEAPKKIKINNVIYEYRGYMYCTEKANYQDIEDYLFGKWNFNILNNEVEILDEEPKPITKESIEALGYACGEIRKCFENGWNKSLENKPLIEEDKKIEKLNDEVEVIEEDKQIEKLEGIYAVDHKWQSENNNIFVKKINELIDEINNLKEK